MTEPLDSTLICGIAVVRREDGYILVAKRRAHDSFGGYWEFPGGKKRDAETFEECVRREVKEELGVDVTVGKFLQKIDYEYPDHPVALHFYLCSLESGEPQPLICDEVKWILPAARNGLKFLPASRPMIDWLAKNSR